MGKENLPLLYKDANSQIIQDSVKWNTFRLDKAGGSVLVYVGYARPGAAEDEEVWQIMKLGYDGADLISGTYPTNAEGNVSNKYEFKWSLRATYVYA